MVDHNPADLNPMDTAGRDLVVDPVVMIRHEEQLIVDTETVPVERVRLQKIIVSEEQIFTVTVRREEVRVIREPITGHPTTTGPDSPTNTPQIIGTPQFMVLHEERVVMTTEVVPVERVWLRTHQVTDTETIRATVAHEEIAFTTAENPRHGAHLDESTLDDSSLDDAPNPHTG